MDGGRWNTLGQKARRGKSLSVVQAGKWESRLLSWREKFGESPSGLGKSEQQSQEETPSAPWLSYPGHAAYDNGEVIVVVMVVMMMRIRLMVVIMMMTKMLWCRQWWRDWIWHYNKDAINTIALNQYDKAICACSVQISFYVAGLARNSVSKNCSKSTQIVTNTLQGAFTVVILFVTSPLQNIHTLFGFNPKFGFLLRKTLPPLSHLERKTLPP